MIPNIININGDFDDDYFYYEPDLSELDDYLEESEIDCEMCGATGEGYSSGTVCSYCHGSGVVKRKH